MSVPPRPPMMHPMQGGGPGPGGPIRPPGYPVMGPRPPGQMVSLLIMAFFYCQITETSVEPGTKLAVPIRFGS